MSVVYLLLFVCMWSQTLSASHFPTLSNEEWDSIAPFILPDNHPIKPALDQIFSKGERVVRTQTTLEKAGFKIIRKGHWSQTVIALHKDAKEVYFKLFTEDQTDINEIPKLLDRIKGAKLAQSIVDKYNWNKTFKVPRKWLYLLPDDPSPIPGNPSKRMVLIAENMNILCKKENYAKWKGSALKPQLLDKVFILLTEGGFNDSAFAFNLPFAKDGRIAVIDNESYQHLPVPCYKLLQYLNSHSKSYWQRLINASPELAY